MMFWRPSHTPGVAGNGDDVLEDHMVCQEVEVIVIVDQATESFPDDPEEGPSVPKFELSLAYLVICAPR
jgi:hypothetical protein